jgi:hypothetical protein
MNGVFPTMAGTGTAMVLTSQLRDSTAPGGGENTTREDPRGGQAALCDGQYNEASRARMKILNRLLFSKNGWVAGREPQLFGV